jgi:hypothetical protein
MFREIKGDMWALARNYAAVCVTTNGVVKKDGRAVMGAGVALQATKEYLGCDMVLGQKLKLFGNHTQIIANHLGRPPLIAFPNEE